MKVLTNIDTMIQDRMHHFAELLDQHMKVLTSIDIMIQDRMNHFEEMLQQHMQLLTELEATLATFTKAQVEIDKIRMETDRMNDFEDELDPGNVIDEAKEGLATMADEIDTTHHAPNTLEISDLILDIKLELYTIRQDVLRLSDRMPGSERG